MKTAAYLSCLIITLSLVASSDGRGDESDKKAQSITTITGKKYEGVRVTKVLPDGLMIMHSAGAAKVPFSDLPVEIQKQYGYDPDKAAEFAKKDAQQQAAVAQKLAQERRGIAMRDASRRKEEAAAEAERAAKMANIPRVLNAQQIKNFWLNTFPKPRQLASNYSHKKREYEALVGRINSGDLDSDAQREALTWNIAEYQRVGDSERASMTQSQLRDLEDRIHKERMAAIEAEKAAQLQNMANSLQSIRSSLSGYVTVWYY